MNHQLVRPDNPNLLKYIKWNEGVRRAPYIDSKGMPTVGVGFSLRRREAPEIISRLGYDYEELVGQADRRHKSLTLSGEAVDRLLTHSLERLTMFLPKLVADAESLSESRQIVVYDLMFDLGIGGFLSLRSTRHYINQGDWRGASDGLLCSQYSVRSAVRAKRNAYALLQDVLPTEETWNSD